MPDSNSNNSTRQSVPLQPEGVEQLPTGYAVDGNDPSTFYIPSCGLEDVDTAVRDLFDKDMKFRDYQSVTGTQKQINLKKPPVIFAAGERFALAKALKPFRDRNGVLTPPIISIRRTGLEQQSSDTFLGELTIKKRLDDSDKDYQQLLNRLLLKNVPAPAPSSLRTSIGAGSGLPSIHAGMLLDDIDPRLMSDHVYEVIKIPFPQFFTATYEITYWTSYTSHMNYLVQTTLSNQMAPGKGFYLKSDKGYWFTGILDEAISYNDNFDDMTDEERIIKNTFTMKVRGFLLASQGPGQRVPFKRYLSAVNISFEAVSSEGDVQELADSDKYQGTKTSKTNTNAFVLSDIEQSPTKQKPTVKDKFLFRRETVDRSTGVRNTHYVRQTDSNEKQGETVYTASDETALAQFFLDRK